METLTLISEIGVIPIVLIAIIVLLCIFMHIDAICGFIKKSIKKIKRRKNGRKRK